MAANTHKTLYNDIFFHGIVKCVLPVSLHNSETARKNVSVNLGIGTLFSSVQCSSVAQSCLTLCDPMNRSTPGLPVHHQLPEIGRAHV